MAPFVLGSATSNDPAPTLPESAPPSNSNWRTCGSTWLLYGEIDSPTVGHALASIRSAPPDLPLLLLIDSCGGLAHSTLGLMVELRRFASLETRAIAFCASAAVHLLQAGKLRTCYPHTCFFTHALQAEETTVDGSTIKTFADQFARDTRSWIDVLVSRSTKPRRFWSHWFKTEHYFEPSDALKFGLIDKIVDQP